MQHERKVKTGSRMGIGEKVRGEGRKERQRRKVGREKNVT